LDSDRGWPYQGDGLFDVLDTLRGTDVDGLDVDGVKPGKGGNRFDGFRPAERSIAADAFRPLQDAL
jgi:hypothetical protein